MVTKTIFLVTEHHDSLAEWNVSVQQSTGQRSCIYGGVTSIAETRERRLVLGFQQHPLQPSEFLSPNLCVTCGVKDHQDECPVKTELINSLFGICLSF